ncbi:MAG: tetratricopeptide repeat protein [Saprospiraceae bacterium]|nr:tetratricopeptide repeat protein [Saprospiraceae bacterium]
MAKSGKPNPKSGKQQQATPSQKKTETPSRSLVRESKPRKPVEIRNLLERPSTHSPSDPLLRKIFWGMAAAGLLVLVIFSFGSGINADDKFQVDYSQKLVRYYSTFGKDTAALNIPDGNMHLYGGFFEVVTGFANKALGFEPTTLAYHHVRHASSAVLGWVAMLCAALFAQLFAGWRAGLITLIFMLLSPRFVGDSLMNPKDIPFAAGYMMAIYNMAAVLERMPNPRRWNVVGLVVGLGIALATRAGGLLSFAMLGLFALLHFWLKNGGLAAFSNGAVLRRYALVVIGAAVAGYAFALLFWPFGLQAPLKNPFEALSKFADLEVKIRVLYEGANVMSDKTPWHYPLKWMFYTIPLAVILGVFGSLLGLFVLLKKYNPLWVSLALFAAVFPVFYVIYKNSVIHDGWRHLTFAYPPLCVAAALAWNELVGFFEGKKYAQWATYGLMGVLLADAGAFIVSNHKFPYVYFNPIVGGAKGAYDKFETDYWGVSVRQGLEWLESQGVLRPDMKDTVAIATNMFYSARQLTDKYGDKVHLKYLKWERRCDEAWDYALYPSRFIDGATLQKGSWPPSNAVYVVRAGGAPLLAVLKDDTKHCATATAAFKSTDWPTAIEHYKSEVAAHPDNDIAWVGMSLSYLNLGELEESKKAAERAIEITPDDPQANNLIGMYWMNKNDAAKAKSQFELALRKESNNPMAWYYLAIIARSQQDNQTALKNLMNAIELAPNFKQAYEMSAQIYESQGNTQAAQRFRAALGQLQ